MLGSRSAPQAEPSSPPRRIELLSCGRAFPTATLTTFSTRPIATAAAQHRHLARLPLEGVGPVFVVGNLPQQLRGADAEMEGRDGEYGRDGRDEGKMACVRPGGNEMRRFR